MHIMRIPRLFMILLLLCFNGVALAGAPQGSLYATDPEVRDSIIWALADLGFVKRDASMEEHEDALYTYINSRRRFVANIDAIPRHRSVDLAVCLLSYVDKRMNPQIMPEHVRVWCQHTLRYEP